MGLYSPGDKDPAFLCCARLYLKQVSACSKPGQIDRMDKLAGYPNPLGKVLPALKIGKPECDKGRIAGLQGEGNCPATRSWIK